MCDWGRENRGDCGVCVVVGDGWSGCCVIGCTLHTETGKSPTSINTANQILSHLDSNAPPHPSYKLPPKPYPPPPAHLQRIRLSAHARPDQQPQPRQRCHAGTQIRRLRYRIQQQRSEDRKQAVERKGAGGEQVAWDAAVFDAVFGSGSERGSSGSVAGMAFVLALVGVLHEVCYVCAGGVVAG